MTAPIRAVYEDGRLRLLDPVDLAEGEQVSIAILRERGRVRDRPVGALSARNLLKLPAEQRDRILEGAAARAEEDYRTDPDLTDFIP
jgi:predicted DNA-binding antitoxin AbrB/MazE fold protein